jgi:putative acetyltransferase
MEVVRQSITVLCEVDHQNDRATLDRWLANKRPESFESWIANPENFCVVAESEGIVRGVGLLHGSGEIRLLYISPGYQHRGLGRRIHSALEIHALSLDLPKLRLESTRRARPFYEALGYIPAGAEKAHFGVLRVYPYEKPLSPK